MPRSPIPRHSESAVRALRIAYVIDTLRVPAGGTEGQLLHLLEGLDRSRFEPTVFCLHGNAWIESGVAPAPIEVLGLHVRRHPALVWSLGGFARRLRRGRFDLVQTHFRDANLAGLLAARWAGVPIRVSTRRGVPYHQGPRELRVLRWLNRSVDAFVANSEATRQRYCREEGIDPARMVVIPNGLDPARFARPPDSRLQQLRRQLDLPAADRVVGIVANLRRVKGLDDFMVAAARVLQTHPATHFLIVGEGEDRPRLEALRAELGLDAAVRLLGARTDVPELLHVFDVGVLSSHFESFSNSILEYLAADLPVVVTDVGGAREAVRDGEEGFVVPARDPEALASALRGLLDHPGGPRRFRRRHGLDPRFGLAHMVHAHERLYQRLAADHRG